MTRTRILWTALIVAALLPALAFARPGAGPGGARGFFPPPGYLDLNEEQAEATRAIVDDFREEAGVLRETHRALRDELRTLLEGENPDPAAVGEIVIEIHGERGQFRALREASAAEFEALLTAEQLVKWENFQELRSSRRHRGEGHGPRDGRGPRGGFGGPAGDFGGPVSD